MREVRREKVKGGAGRDWAKAGLGLGLAANSYLTDCRKNEGSIEDLEAREADIIWVCGVCMKCKFREVGK